MTYILSLMKLSPIVPEYWSGPMSVDVGLVGYEKGECAYFCIYIQDVQKILAKSPFNNIKVVLR